MDFGWPNTETVLEIGQWLTIITSTVIDNSKKL